ncbi:hypothetical protein BGX34_006839 [Mortierella sp. NVP85]|nr:hypothetical protein BGX34_006839 [Mortierella sp. NVP85]
MTDKIPKIAAYVTAAVFLLLGVSGLAAVFIKKYALAKNFSVLWWTVTLVTTALSVTNLILLATREKDDVKTVCESNLLQEYYRLYGDTFATGTLAGDVDKCYKWVMIIVGVVTGIQLFVMIIGGAVASRYTREVRQRFDAISPPVFAPGAYGQKVEPLLQPAHPYTHIGKH